MTKFTLKMEQGSKVIEVTFKEEYLDNILLEVDMFRRGCGYVADGSLQYVDFPEKSNITLGTVDESAFNDYRGFGNIHISAMDHDDKIKL